MKKLVILINIVLGSGMLYCMFAILILIAEAENVKGKIVKEELLRGEPIGIAVDSKQNIYIGSSDKGEIFVYDMQGNYEYSICFSTAFGNYTYGIANDKLYILITRNDYISIYENNQVTETSMKVPPEDFQEAGHKFKQGTSIYRYIYGKKEIKLIIDDNKEIVLGRLKITNSEELYYSLIVLLWGIIFAINFAKKLGLDKLKKYLEY